MGESYFSLSNFRSKIHVFPDSNDSQKEDTGCLSFSSHQQKSGSNCSTEADDTSLLQKSLPLFKRHRLINDGPLQKCQSFVKQPTLSPCFENKPKRNHFNFSQKNEEQKQDNLPKNIKSNNVRRSSYHIGIHSFQKHKNKEVLKELRRKSLLNNPVTSLDALKNDEAVHQAVEDLSKSLRVGSTIGQGGFGKVTVGSWEGNKSAFKLIPKHKLSSVEHEKNALQFSNKYLVSTYAVLSDIDKLTHMDTAKTGALVISELCSTVTMQTLIHKNGDILSYRNKIRMLQELCGGLQYLHDMHFAHLDVKPANCFLTQSGQIKLGDFGCCTRLNEKPSKVLGTAAYQSPEVLKGQVISNRSDIYSVGITAWSLITQRTPYEGMHPHVIIYRVTRLGQRPSIVNTSLNILSSPPFLETLLLRIVERCWISSPLLRPTAEVMHRILGALKSSAANG